VLDPGWTGVEGVFGGHLLGVAVDAARRPGYRVQALSLSFVSSVHPGPVEVSTEPVHQGRSTATVRLSLSQTGRVRVHGLASLVRALVSAEPAQRWEAEPAPVRPGPEAAPPHVAAYGPLAYLDRLEVRSAGAASLADGTTLWVRAVDPAASGLMAPGLLASYLDVAPPGLFAAHPPPRFVPSLDLTVHLSSRVEHADVGEWFSVHNRTLWSDTFGVDDCELRDVGGHLLALLRQGRQARW
jgi:hypothetical protein